MLPFFVYGTLKPGEPNYARLLAGRSSAELPASLAAAALYTEGPYPFLVTAAELPGAVEVVQGCLIAIPPELYAAALAELDALEGYADGREGNLYERVVCEVLTERGPRAAWVYVAGAEPLARIRQGRMRHITGGVWVAGPAQTER